MRNRNSDFSHLVPLDLIKLRNALYSRIQKNEKELLDSFKHESQLDSTPGLYRFPELKGAYIQIEKLKALHKEVSKFLNMADEQNSYDQTYLDEDDRDLNENEPLEPQGMKEKLDPYQLQAQTLPLGEKLIKGLSDYQKWYEDVLKSIQQVNDVKKEEETVVNILEGEMNRLSIENRLVIFLNSNGDLEIDISKLNDPSLAEVRAQITALNKLVLQIKNTDNIPLNKLIADLGVVKNETNTHSRKASLLGKSAIDRAIALVKKNIKEEKLDHENKTADKNESKKVPGLMQSKRIKYDISVLGRSPSELLRAQLALRIVHSSNLKITYPILHNEIDNHILLLNALQREAESIEKDDKPSINELINQIDIFDQWENGLNEKSINLTTIQVNEYVKWVRPDKLTFPFSDMSLDKLKDELTKRASSLSEFEHGYYKEEDFGIKSQIQDRWDAFELLATNISRSDETSAEQTKNLIIENLVEFDQWLERKLLQDTLLKKAAEQISRVSELQKEYPTLTNEIKFHIKSINDSLAHALLLSNISDDESFAAQLSDALAAFDLWESQIAPEKKKISDQERKWISYKLAMEIDNLKKEHNLHTIPNENEELDVKGIDGGNVNQTAANQIKKISAFLVKFNREAKAPKKAEVLSPRENKSVAAQWAEIFSMEEDDSSESHQEDMAIPREYLISDLKTLKNSISTAGKIKKPSRADEVINKIIKIIESGNIPQEESEVFIPPVISQVKNKGVSEHAGESTLDSYSALSFAHLKDEIEGKVAIENIEQYPNYGKSFGALALVALVGIVKDDSLDESEKVQIENQLRSSLRAWDNWKVNLSTPEKKIDLASQDNKTAGRAVTDGEKTQVLKKLYEVSQRLLSDYKLRYTNFGLNSEGQFRQIIVPRDDNTFSNEIREIIIRRVMDISELRAELMKENEMSTQELRHSLQELKDKMHPTAEKNNPEKVSSKTAIDEIIEMINKKDKVIKISAPTQQSILEEKHAAKKVEARGREMKYPEMTREELSEELLQRVNDYKSTHPNEKSYPNHSGSYGKNALDLLIQIAKKETKPVPEERHIEHQLRSSLKAWDEWKPNQSAFRVKAVPAGKESKTASENVPKNDKIFVAKQLKEEVARLRKEYKLTDLKVEGDSRRIIVPASDKMHLDPQIDIAIRRIMDIDEFSHELMNKDSISKGELNQGLKDLQNKMHSTGPTESAGVKNIQFIIDALKDTATVIKTPASPQQAVSETKQKETAQVKALKKEKHYSDMNYDELVEAFNEHKQNYPYAQWRNASQKSAFIALDTVTPLGKLRGGLEHHLRSILKEWDDSNTKPALKETKEVSPSSEISKNTKNHVIAALNEEFINLMDRYSLEKVDVSLQGYSNNQFLIMRQPNTNKKSDKDVETAISRLMEIEGLVIKLERSDNTPISETQLLEELRALKSRMRSTGIITESTSAKAIEKIIEKVKDPYKNMTPMELAKALTDRFYEEYRFKETPITYPNWGESHAAKVLEAVRLGIADEIKESVSNQLRSSLRAWDDWKTGLAQKREPVFTKNVGQVPLDQHIASEKKENIIRLLSKEKTRLEKSYNLENEFINKGEDDFDNVEFLVRGKGNTMPDKNVESVIRRIMDIDDFICELQNKENVVTLESLRKGLTELKGKMHSTGIKKSTGAGKIDEILGTLKTESKQALPESQEAKEAVVNSETVAAATQALKKEKQRILNYRRGLKLTFASADDNKGTIEEKEDIIKDKSYQNVMAAAGEIDALIDKLDSATKTPITSSALKTGLTELRDHMRLTGLGFAFGIDVILDTLQAESKQALPESQEVKKVNVNADTINAIGKLLVDEKYGILNAYGLELNYTSDKDGKPEPIKGVRISQETLQRAGADIAKINLFFDKLELAFKSPITNAQLKEDLETLKSEMTMPAMKPASKGIFKFFGKEKTRETNIDKAIRLAGEGAKPTPGLGRR